MNEFKKVVQRSLSLAAAVLLTVTSSGFSSGVSEVSAQEGEPVTFWYMGDGTEHVQPILDAFTEETGIEVSVQSIPWGSAHDRLLTSVASGDGPDVVQMGTTWMAEFSDAGALMDITEYVENSEALNPDNFFEGNVQTNVFDEKYYGVPWYTETRALYYRTDLLEEVGYSEAPATWEELKDAAVKLSERGDNMYGFNVDGADQSFSFMFARQNGADLFNENNEPQFTQPEFVETIEYLNSFITEGAAPAQDLGLDISQTFGGDGIVPMFVSGPWMINAIQENAPDIEGKWATAVLPTGSESNLSNTGGANLAIWQGTENVDNAIALIEYISRPESQLQFMELSSSLPANVTAWEDESLQNELIQPFGEQLENSAHMPLIPAWERIAQTYLGYWEQISVGGGDITEQLEAFNEEATSILR